MFLGRGKFGVVFKYDEKTAMKLFNQNPLCFDIVGKNEIELFNKLNHVQFKNVVLPSELIIYNDECKYIVDIIEN